MLKAVLRKREEPEQRNPDGSYLQFAKSATSFRTYAQANALLPSKAGYKQPAELDIRERYALTLPCCGGHTRRSKRRIAPAELDPPRDRCRP